MSANYIIINSKFRPFSYAEMLQPIQMANTEHQNLENQYAELSSKTSIWDRMIDPENDSEAYNVRENYKKDLMENIDSLEREGLTPTNRKNLFKMRDRYASDIIPIEQAYVKRQGLIDEQRKLRAQDNKIMFDRDASTLRLSELINNPELTYQPYSGATIQEQVKTAAKNLSKQMRDDPRKWQSILNGQYFETKMKSGYTLEEILLSAINDKNAPKELRKIVEDAIDSSNIRNWGNQEALERAYEYAVQGLWDALGNTQYQVQANRGYLQPTYSTETGMNVRDNNLYYRTVNKTTIDSDKKTSQMQEDLDLVNKLLNNPELLNQQKTRSVREPKYFYPDPTTSLILDSGLGESRQETYYPYQEKLQELSKRYGDIHYDIVNGTLYDNNLVDLAKKLDNDIRSSAVRSLTYKLNITQGDLMNQVIEQNIRSYHRDSGHTGIYEVKKDGYKGKEIDIDDINDYINSDGSLDYNPDLGLVITTKDKDGKQKSAVLDTELIDDPGMTLKRLMNDINTALEYGEPEAATAFIDGYEDESGNYHMGLMEYLYKKFNTLVKRQGNTTSKDQ